MAGQPAGKVPDHGASCMETLRTLGREEIFEILSQGLCRHCDAALQKRVQTLTERKLNDMSIPNEKVSESSRKVLPSDSANLVLPRKSIEPSTATWVSTRAPGFVFSGRHGEYISNSSSRSSFNHSDYEILLNDGLSRGSSRIDNGMSEQQKECIRFQQVSRKKNFAQLERINGKFTNVLQGLELHTRVFNTEEQRKIVECIYNLQLMGQKNQLMARTYSEPRKWMRGKGRVTMQFGCCYNYAVDKDGNPPGIIRDEEVDPLPYPFKQMIKRMVRWHVLPPSCIPNSCIVNIYEEGDCIPPHIDHHDFVRPFCTVSFLTECNILFGSNLKILSPGEFAGPVSIALPVGSVLVLNGNGADVAKHCVPGVPSKRISITFRKMDDSKLPYSYSPDPELLGIKLFDYSSSLTKSRTPVDRNNENKKSRHNESQFVAKTSEDDFPPLGRANSFNRQRIKRHGLRS